MPDRPSFYGYPRPDGTFGARNHVAVIPSVTCAGDVAQAVCRQVAGTVCYLHHQGCCQLPPDLERVTDTLISLGKSPNVGAVLIVTLGCEGTDHERMYEELAQTGKPVRKIAIQELGGTAPAIARGIEEARELVLAISAQQRVEAGIENVVMSIKCGASDTTSGMASNCVIGRVADRLVDLGATVVFGETTEFIGGEDLLAARAVSPEVARRIYEIVDAMETRAKSVGCDMRRGQPTPGNIAGGLSSIEEKSLGAIVKSGTRPIQGVLDYPETAFGKKGLWIKDTPGREPEILTGMAATGAQFMCFSTGRGAPQGFPSMPVVKICGNPHTYQRMRGDMDVDAGRIIEGAASIDEVADETFELILRVLSGELTKNEAIGYTSSIDIHCLGPVI
ncbi:galactonate dehydratase [Olsenella sp. An285]|uniref:UxaA family hydrolase n=1 Tax=Olsenella sp. An285 TaxID=1965621 RepID=UPI000B375BBE|nr:UxaA family hydrolase [Olsenella sp. An285]OUO45231.1 galactonate dehydratase [Olsenella sp. An285]